MNETWKRTAYTKVLARQLVTIDELVAALKYHSTQKPHLQIARSTHSTPKTKPVSLKEWKKWLPFATKSPSPLRQAWHIDEVLENKFECVLEDDGRPSKRLKAFSSNEDWNLYSLSSKSRFANINHHIRPINVLPNIAEQPLGTVEMIPEVPEHDDDDMDYESDALWVYSELRKRYWGFDDVQSKAKVDIIEMHKKAFAA